MMDTSKPAAADFTVIMAIYAGDTPAFAMEAFESLQQQTLVPTEILVVVDGPIGGELQNVVHEISAFPGVRVLRLPDNRGAGAARDAAIRQAKHEIIAIMDADDLCDVHRFERQIPIIAQEQADLVGAWIEEFDKHPGDLRSVRKVPTDSKAIYDYGKWRQPVNHVTVVFRRSAYLAVDGYSSLRRIEDYDFLVRMLVQGFVLRNVPEILVHVRAGGGYLQRRQGMAYIREEIGLYRRMYRWGYINAIQFAGNVLSRIVIRFFPFRAFQLLYKVFLRHDSPASRRSGERGE